MESEIDWDELEREIDEALIDSAPAPRSPTARIGQKRRATADEKSDPTSPLDLCASFAEFVKAKGLPRPVSDSAHRCRVSECSYFRRGTHFVCLKTGRLHRCSATECTEKKAPSAIPLNGDGYVLRQRDGEVCPVTGETFALDPQLDFHQECLVESGAAEAEDSVAAGQVTKARKKEVKRDTRPTINERRKRQIRETIEEILLPEKKSEWGPHRPDLVLRVANLLSLLKDEGNPPRYSIVAALYILSNGLCYLCEEIISPDLALSQWITPMKSLVNRDQSYKWLAKTLSEIHSSLADLYSKSPLLFQPFSL